MLQFWMRITEGFTDRAITFPSNELPALAGIADRFGATIGSEYMAGLWRVDIPVSLMWSRAHVRPAPHPILDEVSVPSWSWTSIGGPVHFDQLYTNERSFRQFGVKVVNCQTQLADERSPYGAVSQLTIRCHVQRVMRGMEGIHDRCRSRKSTTASVMTMDLQ